MTLLSSFGWKFGFASPQKHKMSTSNIDTYQIKANTRMRNKSERMSSMFYYPTDLHNAMKKNPYLL